MAQDGGESNVLDPLDFYVEPRPMRLLAGALECLSDHLYDENASGQGFLTCFVDSGFESHQSKGQGG